MWSNYGCLNHDLSKRGLLYAVGFNIRQGWYHCKLFPLIFTLKVWSHLSFTKIIDSFWIYIKNPNMYSSISISSSLWVTYMTGNILHWYTDHTIGANWKPCFYHVLIFIKNRFNFLPMFLNILICYYEEKKLKLLIIVCRFESPFYIYHLPCGHPLNIFFSQPPIFENIF